MIAATSTILADRSLANTATALTPTAGARHGEHRL
jgi:hypothetical protein